MSNPREYGLGTPGEPIGKPVAKLYDKPEAVCPNCGCETVYDITVEVVMALSPGTHTGICKYLGCPACPWASPSITSIKTPNPSEN